MNEIALFENTYFLSLIINFPSDAAVDTYFVLNLSMGKSMHSFIPKRVFKIHDAFDGLQLFHSAIEALLYIMCMYYGIFEFY